MTTVALYLVGCVLVAGAEVLFLLAGSLRPARSMRRRPDRWAAEQDGAAGVSADREAAAGVAADDCAPGGFAVDDFVLWERELRGGRGGGREHDQWARRRIDRWERDLRRRRRQSGL